MFAAAARVPALLFPARRGPVAATVSERLAVSAPAPGADDSADLIEAVARHRDRAAFAELFRRFAPRVKAFVMRSGADPDTAQEVAQETMVLVWRRAETFDRSRAGAATWIFTIARNKRIDLLRRATHAGFDPDDYVLFSTEAPESADSAAIGRQVRERIAAVMQHLAPDQIDVLRMAFFQDKSHSVIAREMKLPLGTVKSRIRLALSRLREALQGDVP
ncbi:MAG: sigma-70 family RNA polymerase sigma factor [Alphaproteobacteria bacterium]|nr:sigma-70 family RNA polymerase sigma factor [Alphaproteobacteria bacterium]MCW5742676.1 sigma-70 family RNA polymerase sigma factor [Alphaproteobacteria bacterium]